MSTGHSGCPAWGWDHTTHSDPPSLPEGWTFASGTTWLGSQRHTAQHLTGASELQVAEPARHRRRWSQKESRRGNRLSSLPSDVRTHRCSWRQRCDTIRPQRQRPPGPRTPGVRCCHAGRGRVTDDLSGEKVESCFFPSAPCLLRACTCMCVCLCACAYMPVCACVWVHASLCTCVHRCASCV